MIDFKKESLEDTLVSICCLTYNVDDYIKEISNATHYFLT